MSQHKQKGKSKEQKRIAGKARPYNLRQSWKQTWCAHLYTNGSKVSGQECRVLLFVSHSELQELGTRRPHVVAHAAHLVVADVRDQRDQPGQAALTDVPAALFIPLGQLERRPDIPT
eukprot:scaffold65225_cov47-Prasinocladus_malaysianus.AAC.1